MKSNSESLAIPVTADQTAGTLPATSQDVLTDVLRQGAERLLAQDTRLERDVAIKVLPESLARERRTRKGQMGNVGSVEKDWFLVTNKPNTLTAPRLVMALLDSRDAGKATDVSSYPILLYALSPCEIALKIRHSKPWVEGGRLARILDSCPLDSLNFLERDSSPPRFCLQIDKNRTMVKIINDVFTL